MSLNLLQQTIPIQYEPCVPGDGVTYNAYLCTPPRIYREEIFKPGGIQGFWYDEAKDRYILLLYMEFALWPSWRVNSYEIHPETGLITASTLTRSILYSSFTRNYANGDFRKVYSNSVLNGDILNVDPVTLVSDFANPVVIAAKHGSSPVNSFIINRSDKILVLGQPVRLDIWDYDAGTKLASVTTPELTTRSLAYEDNERVWAVLGTAAGGTAIMKVNYKKYVPELYTVLQPGSTPDLDARIAYDSKRKNVAIFRQRDEDTDGACLSVLGIYKPFTLPTNLTAPVPVQKIVKGQTSTLIANLIGDRGEVGQVKPVTASNSGAGVILQPVVTPRSNGSVAFQYLAGGTSPDTDTITLEVTI